MYFIIEGNTIRQKRARSKAFQRPYDPQKREKADYQMQIKSQMMQQKKTMIKKGVPIYFQVRFYIERPASHFKKGKRELKKTAPRLPCTSSTADLDNLIKFVKDCLNKIAWHDDCQVVKYGPISKEYSDFPRTEILIEENILIKEIKE